MPLGGKQLTIGWALALCYYAGFRARELTVAVALMTAESGRYTGAWHENLDDFGNVTSTDWGLFQINDRWHPTFNMAKRFDPIYNTQYAYSMSSGKHFIPWMAYVNKAHVKYLPMVWAVRVLGLWHKKVYHVEEVLGNAQ